MKTKELIEYLRQRSENNRKHKEKSWDKECIQYFEGREAAFRHAADMLEIITQK